MKCHRCGHQNRETAKFCEECGNPFSASCPQCGHAVTSSAKFCDSCGLDLSKTAHEEAVATRTPPSDSPTAPPVSAGERRRATVVFSDLSGYTAMNERLDPEEVEGLMSRIKAEAVKIVERCGGTVNQFVGDEVLALFGIPTAHEDDPVRAVRAAQALRDFVRGINPEVEEKIGATLAMHTGISTGLIVTNLRDQRNGKIGITGDTVNTGARLASQAKPDEILVSAETNREILEVFATVALEPVELRGKAKPVVPHRVVGEARDGGRRRLPFVGRESEVRDFAILLETCITSGVGNTVYLRGDPGIGKTRLLGEFERLALEMGFSSHRGLVLDFGLGVGRDALGELLRSLLASQRGEPEDWREDAATTLLAEGLAEPHQEVFINDLLGLPLRGELRGIYDAMDNETRKRGRRETVDTIAIRASWQQPRLLLVEDIHWADEETLSHLQVLSEATGKSPMVLAMTSRLTGDPLGGGWGEGNGAAPLRTLDLKPLQPQEAFALAGGFLDVTSQLAINCIERAEGNPLFLEQLLRGAEDATAGEVPGSVQSLVLARMDKLDAGDKFALQAASAIGQRFNPALLRELVEEPQFDCTRLMEHHLVRPEGEDFLFCHALIREGVYGSMLKSSRREIHRRAAEWFASRDRFLSAQHLELAEDSRAPLAFLEAAEEQRAAYRHELALETVGRGLALALDPGERFELTRAKGYLLYNLTRVPESIAVFEEAGRIAQNDGQKARAWIGQAVGMRTVDRNDDALEALNKAELAAEGLELTQDMAQLHYIRGNLYFPIGNLDGCLHEHQTALELARKVGSVEYEARLMSGLGDAHYLFGRMKTANDHFRRCVDLSRKHGFGRIEVANLHMCGWTGLYLEPVSGALEAAIAAAEKARQVHHPRAELLAQGLIGFLKLDFIGDFSGAGESLLRSAELCRELDAKRFLAQNLADLAKAIFVEGNRDEAWTLVLEAEKEMRETARKFVGPHVFARKGLIAEDPKQKREAFREGEAILLEGCVGHNYFWFYREAMEVMLELGDWKEVERYADALEAFARAEPLPWSNYFVTRSRALASHGAGRGGSDLMGKLESLRLEAERMGWTITLPKLETALAQG